MEKKIVTTLSNDYSKALVELAEFIDTINYKGHMYPDGADKRDFVGYWQPLDFFYRLQGYAEEARRVASGSST